MLEKPQPLDLKPEDLHNWYLEATKKLNPKSYNKEAQKPYRELSEEQKFIDKFIRKKILQRIKSACEFYLRYKDNPRLFLAKEADSKTVISYIREIQNVLGYKNPHYIAWKLAKIDYNEWLFRFVFKDVLEEKE